MGSEMCIRDRCAQVPASSDRPKCDAAAARLPSRHHIRTIRATGRFANRDGPLVQPAAADPIRMGQDSGSHKVQRECETHLTSHHHNSVNTMDLIKNSSDLERVAATEHESDEFFIRSIIVTQKSSIATEITSRLCCTLWDPESP